MGQQLEPFQLDIWSFQTSPTSGSDVYWFIWRPTPPPPEFVYQHALRTLWLDQELILSLLPELTSCKGKPPERQPSSVP
jgi:hypothetical protein